MPTTAPLKLFYFLVSELLSVFHFELNTIRIQLNTIIQTRSSFVVQMILVGTEITFLFMNTKVSGDLN